MTSSEEGRVLVALYCCVRVIRKTRSGPPPVLREDDVWASDELWSQNPCRLQAARDIIEAQGRPLSQFWIHEHERLSRASWDSFYKRNGDRAYRDRHYVDHVFSDALTAATGGTLVELGAGVGNGIIPLLRTLALHRTVFLDFSPRAIAMLEARADLRHVNYVARVCNVVTQSFGENDNTVDCVTCLFFLSAIAPDHQPSVATKIFRVLKPGGHVVIRDYGRYDNNQLRFAKGHRLADNWYVKGDGTRCYYFSTSDLDLVFRSCHFQGKASYVCQVHANRATRQVRRRVFVQAVYRKRW